MDNLKQLFEDKLTEKILNLDTSQVLEEDLKNLNQLSEGYKPFIKFILQKQKGYKGKFISPNSEIYKIFISPNSEIYQVINGNASRFAAEVNKANKSPNRVGAIIISSQTHMRVLKPVDESSKLSPTSIVHVVMDTALDKYDLEVGPQQQKIGLKEINSTIPYKMNDFLVNESKFSAFIICEDPAMYPKKKTSEENKINRDNLRTFDDGEGGVSDNALQTLFFSDGQNVQIGGEENTGKFTLATQLKWSGILKGLIIGYLDVPGQRQKTVVARINGVDAY